MLLSLDGAAARAGAAKVRRCVCGRCFFFLLGLHRSFVICRGFAFYKRDRTRGADGEAVAEAIAVVVPHELCFSVYDGERALMASAGAGTAAVAEFFVDLNHLANHIQKFLSK
jgi:hypothetical protein